LKALFGGVDAIPQTLEVIPREGVESYLPAELEAAVRRLGVIPREGVESLSPAEQEQNRDRACDPERGS